MYCVFHNIPPIRRKGEYITMRRRTSTKQLLEAVTNNLLQVRKAKCSYKSSNQIDELSRETFLENLQFICESGVFADFVDWHFERNLSEKDEFVFDSGAMNPYSEAIVTVYLRVCDGVNVEEL